MKYRERAFQIGLVSANDFRRVSSGSGLVVEDQETERLSFRYREGMRNDFEWSVEVPILSRGGGFQDPLIDWWHANILHWSDGLRNSTPFGRSVVDVPGSSFGSATGLGDVSGFLAKRFAHGLTVTAGVKLPTGDAEKLLGSGNADAGLYAQKAWSLGRRFYFHAQFGFVAQGKAKELQSARGLVHQEGIALVWQPNGRDAWVGQWQGESSAVVTGVPESDATHRLITFGYQRRLSHSQMLSLYFSEDRDLFSGNFPEGSNIGPDFTMGAVLSFRF